MRNPKFPTSLIVVGIVTIIAVGFALRMILSGPGPSQAVVRPDLPSDPTELQREQDARRAILEARDSQLRSAPSIPHAEINRLPTLIEPFVHPPEHQPDRLTPQAKAALIETLQRYASAWLAETPDEYMEIARSELTNWYPADHRVWRFASDIVPRGKPPIDPNKPEDSLRKLLEITRFSPDYRWTRLLHGEQATLVLTDYVYTIDDVTNPSRRLSADGHDDPRSPRYWFWHSAHGLRLREPVVEPAHLIGEYRGLLTALTFLSFTDPQDKPSIWFGLWYWDPGLGVWHNHISSGHGPHGVSKLMFY